MSKKLVLSVAIALFVTVAQGGTVLVTDEAGDPLQTVMVTQTLDKARKLDTADGGYATPGKTQIVDPEITRFTDESGQVSMPDRPGGLNYRLRKPGFRDVMLSLPADDADGVDDSGAAVESAEVATSADDTAAAVQLTVAMERETDPFKLAAAKPANAWLGALDIGDAETKKHFMLQCTFCHQQGNEFIRAERTPEAWSEIIGRMVVYGSRLSSQDQKELPERLSTGYRALRDDPELVPDATPWSADLAGVTITEWPIGDLMSQTHDMLVAASGLVYVADNIQDRLYEVDPATGATTVYKIPHKPGDEPGGMLAGRMKTWPRHDSTSNAHSLAESEVDRHIFITPSAQRRIVEFDPDTKTFVLHEIGGGVYPHTIRIDQRDRVWFTLALSNQVGMLDRATGKFKLYDLPSRSFGEWLTAKFMAFTLKLISWGVPMARWLPVDRQSTGTPLPYGIDVTPDGKVWFARLHSDEIGVIDPDTDEITMIATPFKGPRRLRTDSEGNLWITAFPESLIARYEPSTGHFKIYDLPVEPRGSETPYSLNVDRRHGVVWVDGNQSNSLMAMDMATESWRFIPLPRWASFTRDVEFAPDGSAYTAISNFPSWHVETMQPTLIRVQLN
jgi:streptogramin lyase